MSRVIIVHQEYGVYIGSFIGLGFWSKLDDGDQKQAISFENRDQAVEYISDWDSIPADMDLVDVTKAIPHYQYVDKDLIAEYW